MSKRFIQTQVTSNDLLNKELNRFLQQLETNATNSTLAQLSI